MGFKVILTKERWEHIIARHPELEDKIEKILETVMRPDEAYEDPTGAIHVLKRQIGDVSDYFVVIYIKEKENFYIRTAYYTSLKRKQRRYKRFKKLKLS